MDYKTFITFNVVGAFLWVTSIMTLGYLFGSLPVVKDNFEYIVIGIVVFSFIPMAIELFNHHRRKHATSYKEVTKTFEKEEK